MSDLAMALLFYSWAILVIILMVVTLIIVSKEKSNGNRCVDCLRFLTLTCPSNKPAHGNRRACYLHFIKNGNL